MKLCTTCGVAVDDTPQHVENHCAVIRRSLPVRSCTERDRPRLGLSPSRGLPCIGVPAGPYRAGPLDAQRSVPAGWPARNGGEDHGEDQGEPGRTSTEVRSVPAGLGRRGGHGSQGSHDAAFPAAEQPLGSGRSEQEQERPVAADTAAGVLRRYSGRSLFSAASLVAQLVAKPGGRPSPGTARFRLVRSRFVRRVDADPLPVHAFPRTVVSLEQDAGLVVVGATGVPGASHWRDGEQDVRERRSVTSLKSDIAPATWENENPPLT